MVVVWFSRRSSFFHSLGHLEREMIGCSDTAHLISIMATRIAKRSIIRKYFKDLKIDNIINMWRIVPFSKHMGIKDSNEVEILAILEALRIFSQSFPNSRTVESDSSNAISWMNLKRGPWMMHFHFMETKHISSRCQVLFQHVGRSAKGMVGTLAKQGMEWYCGHTCKTRGGSSF